MSEALQKKREVVQRFAEIILMNDEGNTMPAHQIAGKAVELYNTIEAEEGEKNETTATERAYILKPNVDVYFGSIRVNAATLTDELAERILARGFERKFFSKCK